VFPSGPTSFSIFRGALNSFSVSRIHKWVEDLKVFISHKQLHSAITRISTFIFCLELNKVITFKIDISLRVWSGELFTHASQILSQTSSELARCILSGKIFCTCIEVLINIIWFDAFAIVQVQSIWATVNAFREIIIKCLTC